MAIELPAGTPEWQRYHRAFCRLNLKTRGRECTASVQGINAMLKDVERRSGKQYADILKQFFNFEVQAMKQEKLAAPK